MVLKAKSENTIQPLRNVTQFSSWVLPSLDGGNKPGFRQPVEEVVEEPEITAEEIAKIQAEELKKIKEAAFKEGFNSGQSAGLAAAKKEIEKQKNALDELMEHLIEPIKQCGEKTQQELLELAFAIARQIVRRELKQDPTQLIAIVREAVKVLPIGTQKIEIALHPEDATMIKNTLSIETESDSNRWKLKDDPAIERGSCLVLTKNSKIDASIDKQIAILFNRMVGGSRSGETHKTIRFDSHVDENANPDLEQENNPDLKLENTPDIEQENIPSKISKESEQSANLSNKESIDKGSTDE